jgi:thermitase
VRKTTLIVTLAVAGILPSTASANPQGGLTPLRVGAEVGNSAQRAGYVPGEVIVKYLPGMPPAQRADVLRDRGASLRRVLPVGRTVLAGIPWGVGVESAVRAFERDPRVAWAEPNAYRRGGAVPNDPFFDEQWGLHNAGQTVDGTAGAAGADIDALQAWERTTGSPDVKVAVVDSGINFDQPDLAPNIWHNPGESGGGRENNGADDDGNGFVDDWRGWDFVQQDNNPSDNYGHGTHVAGTIAARGNNALGVTGVAWRASVIPVRVLDNVDSGGCADTAAGMAYAVRAGARVVNMSLGMRLPCQAERDVIDGAPNTLFVVAAMNDGRSVDAGPVYPCSYPSPNVVCVGATDALDRLADFSNYGAQSVDLAAPGVSILSSYVKWGAKQSLFTDGFEAPLTGRWVTGGSPDTWVRTPFVGSRTGGYSLSNSLLGGFESNTDNWARLTQGLDLTGRRDCAAKVWVQLGLADFDPAQPVEAQDRLIAETSADGIAWGRRPNIVVENNSAFASWYVDLSQLEGRSTGGLRFRLVTNASGAGKGVALDDLEIFCVPPLTDYTGAGDEFAFDFGTSMATPHVSGVAVLMLSLDPQLSAGELKRRILRSVDPLPGLAGKTVSGGRLNAARALEAPTSPAPPVQTPPTGGDPQMPSPSWALKVDLRYLASTLTKRGLRAVLRGGGFHADRLHALSPGRFTLEVKTPRGRTIARGSRSVPSPAVCSLTARLTRQGRTLLRHSRRSRLSLVLTFTPQTGASRIRSRRPLTLADPMTTRRSR